MKGLSVVTTAVLVSACAAAPTPRPEGIRLAGLETAGPRVSLIDKRSVAERETRSSKQDNFDYYHLGDNAISPSAMEIVASGLARALPEGATPQVEVYRLEAGFWTSVPTSADPRRPPFFIMPGAPIGATLLGNLIGHSIVAGIRGGSDAPYARFAIEIAVDERRLAAYENVQVTGGLTAEQALAKAMSAGLVTLERQLRQPPLAAKEN